MRTSCTPFIISFLLLFTVVVNAQRQSIWELYPNSQLDGDLLRRASLGFQTGPLGDQSLFDANQLNIRNVEESSLASRAGLQKGDIVISINDVKCSSALDAHERLRNLVGEKRTIITVERQGKELELKFKPKSEPLEDLEGVTTSYGEIEFNEGTKLRTIVTKPIGSEGKLPAIFISDWTSCSSTEVSVNFQRGWVNYLRGLIQTTGAIVMRVDKPGCGDSQGKCSELDFNETIEYQKRALQQLKNRSDVDQNNIFIDGESVGGFIAPLVAEGQNVKGIIVRAAGATTWFERMVMFERKQRELSGRPLEEIDDDMKKIISFFHYYLVLGMPLNEIFEANPEMELIWKEKISYNSSTKHYGRPITFHQQAQAHNFAQAWIKSGARALVLYGAFDQFESEDASRSLVNVINRGNPGYGTLKVYPNLNHQLEYFETREAALKGYPGRVIDQKLIGVDQALEDTRNWMKELAND